jgi:hypothetical protein
MDGRSREALKIKQANRAAAVGRLLLGTVEDWHEFLEADTLDLTSLPRKNLKSVYHDVQKRLSGEIERFFARNFVDATSRKLSVLCEAIKSHRGLEIPLNEFETQFFALTPKTLSGHPRHSTIVISLWGLQFMYPEHFFAEDIKESLTQAASIGKQLEPYAHRHHQAAKQEKEEIARLIRQQQFASRTCLLSCFNVIEAYFNGIAWEFAQRNEHMERLSNNKRNLITDTGRTKLRDKILRYPAIIGERSLWDEKQDPVRTFLDEMKPFRDALVHPSPFTTPEKFGGYDKLQKLYSPDLEVAKHCAHLTCEIATSVHGHLHETAVIEPPWLIDLRNELTNMTTNPDFTT